MTATPVTIGVSLKMYFGYRDALAWVEGVARLTREGDALGAGVELFVAPTHVAAADAHRILAGTGVRVGAQDLAAASSGPFTGEVSGGELAEAGCSLVIVGHAERRSGFGETDAIVAQKIRAALATGLVPVLCVGEAAQWSPSKSAQFCIEQVTSALDGAPAGRVIVAYEPVWAIGAQEPAGVDHVRAVCGEIRTALEEIGRTESSVIYGGSAGPGLLGELGSAVDGLFLGRFAHDVHALATVLAEADEKARVAS